VPSQVLRWREWGQGRGPPPEERFQPMGLIGDVPTAQTLSCWFQQGGGPCAGQVAMAAKDGISGCSCSDA